MQWARVQRGEERGPLGALTPSIKVENLSANAKKNHPVIVIHQLFKTFPHLIVHISNDPGPGSLNETDPESCAKTPSTRISLAKRP